MLVLRVGYYYEATTGGACYSANTNDYHSRLRIIQDHPQDSKKILTMIF
jgi:hypothetical protein